MCKHSEPPDDKACEKYKNGGCKEQNRRYRVANQEQLRERFRKWYKANPEKERERKRKYREANSEKIQERSHNWYEANSEKVRNRNLRKKYGLDLEDFNTWLEAQGHACRICGTRNRGKAFHVDHCHETKRLRGILCTKCNTMLGQAQDNPAILRAAALYLERTKTDKTGEITCQIKIMVA